MSFESLLQGNGFNQIRKAQMGGNKKKNKYREQSSNGFLSHIEAFTGNSNSNSASASLSKAPYIPADYQYKDIKRVNNAENNIMKGVVKDVNSSVENVVITGQDTTAVANNFLKSNGKNSLANSNVTTVNGVQGAVNAMGIFSKYPGEVASNSNAKFASSDLNIPLSMALPINQNNKYKIISSGEPNSANTVLLGQTAQMPTVSAQNAIGSYAGQNVYVYDRNPLLGNNISYQGDYTSNLSLNINSDMGSNVTVKQCLERAADNSGQSGYAYASVDSYGNCYTGVSPSGNWNSSYTNDIFLCEVFQGVTISNGVIVLGANGGIYNGAPTSNDPTNANLLNTDLDPTILSNVDPIYGASINNVNATYGLSGGMDNKNNMLFNDSVVTASNPTGQSSVTFGTVRTTIESELNCPRWMYLPQYEWLLNWEFGQATYCQPEYTVNYSDIHESGEGQDLTVSYNCGKTAMSLPAQSVYEGTQVTASCIEPMSKYGIFNLQIADNGITSITNSATGDIVWQFIPTAAQQDLLNQSLPLKNGNTVRLNAPRYDWVQQSGVTSTNTTPSPSVFSFPNNSLVTFSPGEFLASPNGICRLKLTTDLKFIIEYSLYNLASDSSGYVMGNISNATPGDESYAMYYIGNIQANNVGSLSYVDMNNYVYSYNQPNGGFPLGDSYIESKNFLPNTNPLTTTSGVTDPTQCGNICSNDDSCGGYTIINGNCNTYTPQSLFPNANRIYQEGSTTYIRDVKVTMDMTDESCSKRVANIKNDVYNNFGNYITGQPMTTDKKCGMAVVLDSEIQSLNSANANAIEKGQIIQNQMTNIYEKQNKAMDDLQTNNMFSHMFEDIIHNVNKEIKTKENNAISKIAAKDNTDLILVSDNYKYIIWGIVTLLLSIAAIKALRIGSS
jgi:hypothetical protein